jgi:ubiquinone/menaquinone biosynthesis C-methylase UbiE
MNAGAQAFDRFATEYDSAVSIERSHDFFLAHLPVRRECVLDVGCGSGLLSFELSRYFRRVVALDISEPMLAIARRKRSACNIEYQHSDVNAFSSEPVFDAIVSHTMLHHLSDIPAILQKFRRWLVPGGSLILLDCVTRLPGFISRWSIPHRTYAFLQFTPDVFKYRLRDAFTLLRFRSCRAWIAHLKSDRYFSPTEFREIYAASLPGAQFKTVKGFMGVLWTASSCQGRPTEPNHTMQRMRASRSAQSQFRCPWPLDRTADGDR